MNTLPESDRAILAELAADSDPEPATELDEREARAAYEAATGEAAAMVRRVVWEGSDEA
jgi:hypothetical protein